MESIFFPSGSRLPGVGTSIFTVMTALAQEHGAINLAQGFPDFACDPALLDAVSEALHAGWNQYAPMPGLPALRERIAGWAAADFGRRYDPASEITITCGATEALLCAIQAIVHPGDEVILLEPAYDAYAPLVRLAGGIPRPLSLQFPDYRIPWDAVEAALGPRTRALLLNSPHNPSGAALHEGDIEALRRLAARHPFLLISDEAYAYMVYDGRPHLSIARYPDLAERAFVIFSFGKTLHATGWKVGYCLAPAPLSAELRKIHQFATFSTATPLQQGIAAYLEARPEASAALPAMYQAKRDLFRALMAGSRFEPLACEGAYFQLMRYDAISGEADQDFALRLIREQGVAAVPVSVFYHDQTDHRVLRFCFAKSEETLREAARCLSAL